MANNNQVITIRGKAMYAKILGTPVLNYSKDGKEWKMDLVIDKDTAAEMKKYGIADRVKSKPDYADGQFYVTFKQSELRKDGTPNKPIKVIDIIGDDWNHDNLIGNDSVVDVTANVRDYGPGKKKGVYIREVRVLDLVPYEGKAKTLDESDPYYDKAKAALEKKAAMKAQADAEFRRDFGLDDDVSDLGDDSEETPL